MKKSFYSFLICSLLFVWVLASAEPFERTLLFDEEKTFIINDSTVSYYLDETLCFADLNSGDVTKRIKLNKKNKITYHIDMNPETNDIYIILGDNYSIGKDSLFIFSGTDYSLKESYLLIDLYSNNVFNKDFSKFITYNEFLFKVYDLQDIKYPQILTYEADEILTTRFEDRFRVYLKQNETINIIDTDKSEIINSIEVDSAFNLESVSSDNMRIIFTKNKQVGALNIETEEIEYSFELAENQFSFNAIETIDGKHIIVSFEEKDNKILNKYNIYNTESQEIITESLFHIEPSISDNSFYINNDLSRILYDFGVFVSSSGMPVMQINSLIYDLENDHPISMLPEGAVAEVNNYGFNKDDTYFFISGIPSESINPQTTTVIWDIEEKFVVDRIFSEYLEPMYFSQKNKYLYFSNREDESIEVYNLEDKVFSDSFDIPEPEEWEFYGMDNQLIRVTKNSIYRYDIMEKSIKDSVKLNFSNPDAEILDFQYYPENNEIVVMASGYEVFILDITDLSWKSSFIFTNAVEDEVIFLDISPDGRYILTYSDADNYIYQVWNLETGEKVFEKQIENSKNYDHNRRIAEFYNSHKNVIVYNIFNRINDYDYYREYSAINFESEEKCVFMRYSNLEPNLIISDNKYAEIYTRTFSIDNICEFLKVSVDDYSERTKSNSIIISPNPASDYIEISIGNKGLQPFANSGDIAIYDVLGNVIISTEDTERSRSAEVGNGGSFSGYFDYAQQPLRIDISHLPRGVYFVRVGDRVEKFVKM